MFGDGIVTNEQSGCWFVLNWSRQQRNIVNQKWEAHSKHAMWAHGALNSGKP